jgi:hypothetical protein
MTTETLLHATELEQRLASCIPGGTFELEAFLKLVEICETTEVPTAAVTTGATSRLLLNPEFVSEYCTPDSVHDQQLPRTLRSTRSSTQNSPSSFRRFSTEAFSNGSTAVTNFQADCCALPKGGPIGLSMAGQGLEGRHRSSSGSIPSRASTKPRRLTGNLFDSLKRAQNSRKCGKCLLSRVRQERSVMMHSFWVITVVPMNRAIQWRIRMCEAC